MCLNTNKRLNTKNAWNMFKGNNNFANFQGVTQKIWKDDALDGLVKM